MWRLARAGRWEGLASGEVWLGRTRGSLRTWGEAWLGLGQTGGGGAVRAGVDGGGGLDSDEKEAAGTG